jgi:uncharacterized protein YkwD
MNPCTSLTPIGAARALACVVAACTTVLGCGPRAAHLGTPKTGPSMASKSAAAARALRWELAPAGPGADAYATAPVEPAATDRISELVMATLGEAQASHGLPPPRLDARMSAAAADLAAIARFDARLPHALVGFAFQRQGIVGPEPHLIVAEFPPGEESSLMSGLLPVLARSVGDSAHVHVGVGQVQRPGKPIVLVIALERRDLELQPIPRALPAGGIIAIEGRMLGDHPSFEILMVRDGGTEEIAAGAGPTMRAEIPCGQYRGLQWIEIVARGKEPVQTLALFPVWCHEAAPDRIALDAPSGNILAASTAEVEARLLELLDRERRERGLTALARPPALMDAARAHSAAMRATQVVAQVLPGVLPVKQRLAAQQVDVIDTLVARTYAVEEVHIGLMNRPSIRRSLLSPGADQAGVGIAIGLDAGTPAIYATYVLARPRPSPTVK